MEDLLLKVTDFINALDWMYMLSFIFIAYSFNTFATRLNPDGRFRKAKKIMTFLPTATRSFIIGLLWMYAIWVFRGYKLEANHGRTHFEILIVSLFFGMLLYQLVIKTLLEKLGVGK